MIARAAALLALCLAGTSAMAEMSVTNARYLCDRGVEVPVVYAHDGETAIAVVVADGQQVLLYGEPAASGARYGWPSDGSSHVWWTKGETATLFWKDGEAGTETVILANCRQQ